MPYAKKQCLACEAFFEPTSGRQAVCPVLECQIWWAEQSRPGETPEQTHKRSIQRRAVVKYRYTNPPDAEQVRLDAIEYRKENAEHCRELDKAYKKRRRDADVEADRKREREKRRRQRAADPEKAKADSRRNSANRRATKPEAVRADNAAWRAKNPEKVRANTVRWRTENPDKARAIWSRRDARKRGGEVYEIVNRRVVAERDGWICQLCFEPIDPDAPYQLENGKNNPWYLNIDHITPLSKGGEHSYANCQASHAVCNNKKNASMPDEEVA